MMPPAVELRAVQLPGREGRLRERPFDCMGPLVDALAGVIRPHLDRPFAFFGHSMGALVAFELARRLGRDGLAGPSHLIVSGRRPPQAPQTAPTLHDLPPEEFKDALRRLGGTPREVLEHADLMQVLTPMLRADFAVVETYRFEQGPALECPVTVLGGLEDIGAPPDALPGWGEHTRGPFRVRMLPGGHFFLHAGEALVLEALAEELAPHLGEPTATAPWPASAEVPPLAGDVVHIWRAPLEQAPECLEVLERTLSADELHRADRFHFPRDRRHFVAARGTLRTLVGRYLGREPGAIQFAYSPQGKPMLGPEADGLRFNLTHSHGLALVALARGREVGVDLEKVRADFDGERLADRFFSAQETAQLRSLPAPRRREAFFRCWTRKEAYVKATGMGLRLPLDCFDVSLTPGSAALLAARHDPGEVRRWSMRDLAPAPGYAGAVAAEGQLWRLWCAEWAGRPDTAECVAW
jgi:surfactin synthase thioesterase subunit/phosphopantetheinyl transferase